MRIHSFQHVPFEDIGSMREDIQAQGHTLSTTHWYKGDSAPHIDDIDALIIMGGPMGVYDEREFPWLAKEKQFIHAAIAADKKVLGICLGAQLIACVQSAKVTQNTHREIGWFNLTIPPTANTHPVANILAKYPEVFHWHGDTFAIPEGAILLASSQACTHQAFSIGENIIGFQFHLETTQQSAQALITHCGNELDGSLYVQDKASILKHQEKFSNINQCMSEIFNLWISNP